MAHDPDVLPPGTRLLEFELERLLGRGGFGLVYLAVDHWLQRRIAIKEYFPATFAVRAADGGVGPRSAADGQALDAGRSGFLGEARLLAGFEHASLVRVLRYWEANGTAYMAMPYYHGPTLRALRAAEPACVGEARLLAIVAPLLDALAMLHAERCYHRDVSPDNIIVQASGTPVLLDFGAARRILAGQGEGPTVVLRPGYAPIEQYVADGSLEQGPWTDIYGVAAVLRWAITGQPPVAAPIRACGDTLRRLTVDPPDGYSAPFLAAIDAGLALRAHERPQNVDEFRALLGLPPSGRASCRGLPGDATIVAAATVGAWPPRALPEGAPPLAAVPEEAVSVGAVSLGAALPGVVPVDAVPAGTVPMGAVPVGAVLMRAGPESTAPASGADEATRPYVDAARRPPLELPAFLGRFHGREQDRQRVADTLREHRLVTITGGGGFGKTRLAVECARVSGGFDAVAFVALTDCVAPERIADRIRAALRMQPTPDEQLRAQLVSFLEGRDVLLVVDGFEHLVAGGAAALVDLLQALPRLRCLVTSRRSLDVAGEAVVALDPLPLPDRTMDDAAQLASPSLALLLDRVQAACPGFRRTPDNSADLVDLCRALEGLPLAIELAAPRLRSLAPADVHAGLARRFELLRRPGGPGGGSARHASLEATIEWSWTLLDASEQQLFAGLSVFRGGWSIADAEAIFAGTDVRDRLAALVAASLVRVEPSGAQGARYAMLDALRAFAADRIGAAGPALRRRHRERFRDLVTEAALSDPLLLRREIANLTQAMSTGLADGDAACALQIGVAARPHWDAEGIRNDELRVLEAALTGCPSGEPVLPEALGMVAEACLAAGRGADAQAYAARAVEIAGSAARQRARARVAAARVDWETRQDPAAVLPSLDTALALAVAADDAITQAHALRIKGTVIQQHGAADADHEQAYRLLERAEAIYQSIGETRWAVRTRVNRAGCLAGLALHEEARRLLAACEQTLAGRDAATRDRLAVANMAGYIESSLKRWPEAAAIGRQCVRIAWEGQATMALAGALWNLALMLAMQPDLVAAARLMPFAIEFWGRSVGRLSDEDRFQVDETRAICEQGLGAARTAALWAEGRALTLREAVALAWSP